jgi:hypothetical protein
LDNETPPLIISELTRSHGTVNPQCTIYAGYTRTWDPLDISCRPRKLTSLARTSGKSTVGTPGSRYCTLREPEFKGRWPAVNRNMAKKGVGDDHFTCGRSPNAIRLLLSLTPCIANCVFQQHVLRTLVRRIAQNPNSISNLSPTINVTHHICEFLKQAMDRTSRVIFRRPSI